MATTPKTFAYGILDEDRDTWFLRQPHQFLLLDAPFIIDLALKHKVVSVIGTMGVPESALGITKLIIEKLASHDEVAIRAFEIYLSGQAGFPAEEESFVCPCTGFG